MNTQTLDADTDMDTRPPVLWQLSQVLLGTLGCHGPQDQLLAVLHECGLDSAGLLRQEPTSPYPVSWPEEGLTLQMQHIKPSAPEQDDTWGLHSITLEAGRWSGPWPAGMNPETVTPSELVELLAPNKESALCTPTMVCLNVVSRPGRSWAGVALFDPDSGKFQSLTLARNGQWEQSSGKVGKEEAPS